MSLRSAAKARLRLPVDQQWRVATAAMAESHKASNNITSFLAYRGRPVATRPPWQSDRIYPSSYEKLGVLAFKQRTSLAAVIRDLVMSA